MDWSLQTNIYFVYTSNPGPGYRGCGGAVKPVDPCSPPQPSGYHTVHFRYLWAGQKTFTFFPKPSLMPKWIELEVNGPGNALKVICQREQDRPWYECPVPDSAFSASTTWRAVDKLHNPEWNTVKPLAASRRTPKDYWIRWYYGKPDIPRDVPIRRTSRSSTTTPTAPTATGRPPACGTTTCARPSRPPPR